MSSTAGSSKGSLWSGGTRFRKSTRAPWCLIGLSRLDRAVQMNGGRSKAWVHSYEDDYRIEQHWRYPEKLSGKLRGFAGVICPTPTYRNLPRAHQVYNIYRNQLMARDCKLMEST